MKLDAPVKMCDDFCRKYKNYDTVLMAVDDYLKYCEVAGIPVERPKSEVFE
jgi:hypothetical protein